MTAAKIIPFCFFGIMLIIWLGTLWLTSEENEIREEKGCFGEIECACLTDCQKLNATMHAAFIGGKITFDTQKTNTFGGDECWCISETMPRTQIWN